MALYEGGGQLGKALRNLMAQWEALHAGWDDSQSRAFEEKYLVPLQQDLRNTATAMGHMAALLEKIKRDCT